MGKRLLISSVFATFLCIAGARLVIHDDASQDRLVHPRETSVSGTIHLSLDSNETEWVTVLTYVSMNASDCPEEILVGFSNIRFLPGHTVQLAYRITPEVTFCATSTKTFKPYVQYNVIAREHSQPGEAQIQRFRVSVAPPTQVPPTPPEQTRQTKKIKSLIETISRSIKNRARNTARQRAIIE